MDVRFNPKLINIDHIIQALKNLAEEYANGRGSFRNKSIAREVIRHVVDDNILTLSKKEWQNAESRVRRLLVKEEEETGRVRNVSYKMNSQAWKFITPKQLEREAKEKEDQKKREDEIHRFCGVAGVDPDDVSCYSTEIRIPYEDFERIMKHYG